MNDIPKSDNPLEGGSTPRPCSRSLVWMPGPANNGGGTAEHEPHANHRSWWYDGQLLLVIVERNDGPEVSAVRVHADGDMLDFANAATDDYDFGWMDQDISWWAILDDILPTNASRDRQTDEVEKQRDQYATMLCEAMQVVYATTCRGDSTDLIDRFEALELTPALSSENSKLAQPYL